MGIDVRYAGIAYPGIAVNARTTLDEALDKNRSSDLLITDLDDTDTPNSAEALAYSFLKRPDKWVSKKFWKWAIHCFFDLYFLRGQEAEEPQWRQFKELFLNGTDELSRHVSWYERHASETLFPGVQDYYRSLPQTKKVYLSRNLQPVTNAFARVSGFDGAVGDCLDEKEGIRTILFDMFPHQQRVIFKGDALRDARILQELRRYQEIGRITSLVSICVQGNSQGLQDSPFDLFIGRDYTILASLLTSRYCAQSKESSPYRPYRSLETPFRQRAGHLLI